MDEIEADDEVEAEIEEINEMISLIINEMISEMMNTVQQMMKMSLPLIRPLIKEVANEMSRRDIMIEMKISPLHPPLPKGGRDAQKKNINLKLLTHIAEHMKTDLRSMKISMMQNSLELLEGQKWQKSHLSSQQTS